MPIVIRNHHPLRLALLSALLLVSSVPVVFIAGASAATALYPDLGTLPPRDLRFATATVDGSQHRVLQFSNTVVNDGPGRLDVIGRIDPRTLEGPAFQRVYDDAGGYTEQAAGRFTWHDVHSHFHFDDWGRYELWTKEEFDRWLSSGRSQGQARKVGTKTSSCALDEEFVKQVTGTPYPGAYTGSGCDLRSDNTLHEGLSPGWGDTYDWYRFEQWIDLGSTPLADGTYVLRSVTDPLDKLYESAGKADSSREGAADNEAMTTFTVSGGVIQDGAAPTGTVMVNDVAATTGSAAVTVGVIGRDDVSGVDAFRLSNDGSSWSSPFTYTSSGSDRTRVTWDLTSAAHGGTSSGGTKTVHAQFRDRSGKWGPTVTDTIELVGPPPSPSASPVGSSAYAAAVVADGPVGYWRLGETSGTVATDVMGRVHGSYENGPALGQRSLLGSDTNAAVGMDGVNDRVRVPNVPVLQLGSPLSLEAWIRPDSLPGTGGWASVVSKPEAYSLQFNGNQLELTVIQSGVRRRLKAPAGTVQVGRVSHVVGTYDGSTQRLFVDGALVASGGLTGPASPAPDDLTIGSWGTAEHFRGTIDEVAVYGRALSPARVTAHHDAGLGGGSPSPSASPSLPTSPSASPSASPSPSPSGGPVVTVLRSGTGAGTVTSSPPGIDCGSSCSAAFPTGTQVSLSARPAEGSTFSGWTGGGPCTGSATTCTFSALTPETVTAVFDQAQSGYPLSVTKQGSGTGRVTSSPAGVDCGTTCTALFPAGAAVTLTAAPSAGSVFTGWTGACTGSSTTCSVTVSATTSVTAAFAPLFDVTVRRSGSGTVSSQPSGISCGTDCVGTYPSGTMVTLSASASGGSSFHGWSGGCSGKNPTCVIVVTAATSVGARFK